MVSDEERGQDRTRSLADLRSLRLMALLRDVIKEHGTMGAAQVLEVNYKTLVRTSRVKGVMAQVGARPSLSQSQSLATGPVSADKPSLSSEPGCAAHATATPPARACTSRAPGVRHWLRSGDQRCGSCLPCPLPPYAPSCSPLTVVFDGSVNPVPVDRNPL